MSLIESEKRAVVKKVRSKGDGDREKEPPTPRKSVVNKSVIVILKVTPIS